MHQLIVVISDDKARAVYKALVQKLGENMHTMRAEHQSDKGKAPLYALGDVLLLHHTSAQGDEYLGMTALELFERSHITEHPVLGVLTHRTGVEEYEVGFFYILGKAVARAREHTLDALAVGDVLLTAVGAHIGERLIAELAYAHQLCGKIKIFDLSVIHLYSLRQAICLQFNMILLSK